MTAPLAAAFLLVLSARAAAAPCRVPVVDKEDRPVVLDETDPMCVAIVAQERRFEKLRTAAGFPADQLTLYLEVGHGPGEENAYYWRKRVALNDAYLRMLPSGSLAYLVSLAHEIGHAVQDRDGDLDWKHAARRAGHMVEAANRSRKVEAHADAIAVELIIRAGYPPNAFMMGREQRFPCDAVRRPSKEEFGVDDTHPEVRDRWINGLLTTPLVVEQLTERRRDELARLGKASPGALNAAFTGSVARDGDVPVGPALSGPRQYRPHFKKDDFDDTGRLRPGRVIVSDLRLAVPGPEAGPVEETSRLLLMSYTDRMADAAGAVVNWWYTRQPLSDMAVRACGRVTGADYGDAVVYGVRQASLDLTERVTTWLANLSSRPRPAPKK